MNERQKRGICAKATRCRPTGARRDHGLVNATPPPWTLVGDLIIDATGDEDTVICRLELENSHCQGNALLICSAHELP